MRFHELLMADVYRACDGGRSLRSMAAGMGQDERRLSDLYRRGGMDEEESPAVQRILRESRLKAEAEVGNRKGRKECKKEVLLERSPCGRRAKTGAEEERAESCNVESEGDEDNG